MNGISLHPLNHQRRSNDESIRGVAQCSRPPLYGAGTRANTYQLVHRFPLSLNEHNERPTFLTPKRAREDATPTASWKSKPAANANKLTADALAIDEETMNMVKTHDQDELERRRKMNRMHQAKHKLKQKKRLEDLESSTESLREEIQQLTARQQVMCAHIAANTSVWSVAEEYLRLFQNGYKEASSTAASGHHERRDFLIAAMATDVAGDRGFGVEAMLEDWRVLSTIFTDLRIHAQRLEKTSEDIMVATIRLTAKITIATLRTGFPQLSRDGEWPQLGYKLLGQRLVMHGSVVFHWDTGRSCVDSVQLSVDMLTPMLTILGNLDDVARVFDGALLTPEGKLTTL